MTRVINDSISARKEAGEVIRTGGVIAFRTDTFYGIGVDPFNLRALERIKPLKGREDGKPILIVISDAADADRFINEKSSLFEIVRRRHWPGALTLVMASRDEVPNELTAGTHTIGVRLPGDSEVRELIRACGGSLTATSANPSGSPPARSANEVSEYFPAGIDLIIDGGEVVSEAPSTVLDISGDVPRLVREGVVSKDELKKILQLSDDE